MEVAEKPWFGDFDVLGWAESDAFLEEGAIARKNRNSRARLDGGSCIIARAWETKMEIPAKGVSLFDPSRFAGSIRRLSNSRTVLASEGV
jgi:hypothetical protein